MIKRNEELGDGLFAQINWTADDVLQVYEDWTREEAEQFLKEIEEDMVETMAEAGADSIFYHRAVEKYERAHAPVVEQEKAGDAMSDQ